jgi:hypothetical protein
LGSIGFLTRLDATCTRTNQCFTAVGIDIFDKPYTQLPTHNNVTNRDKQPMMKFTRASILPILLIFMLSAQAVAGLTLMSRKKWWTGTPVATKLTLPDPIVESSTKTLALAGAAKSDIESFIRQVTDEEYVAELLTLMGGTGFTKVTFWIRSSPVEKNGHLGLLHISMSDNDLVATVATATVTVPQQYNVVQTCVKTKHTVRSTTNSCFPRKVGRGLSDLEISAIYSQLETALMSHSPLIAQLAAGLTET